jgi:hypothetical protein
MPTPQPSSAITPSRATELLRAAEAATQKLAKIKGKTEEKAGEVFKLLETVGGGLAIGAIRGKYGAIEVGPKIPLEVILGLGFHAIGFLDLAGKHSEHVHNMGNSVLTTWAAIEGIRMTGGAVLSAPEVKSLTAKAPTQIATTTAGAPAEAQVEQKPAEQRRAKPAALTNGRGQTAREMVQDHIAPAVVERGDSGQS